LRLIFTDGSFWGELSPERLMFVYADPEPDRVGVGSEGVIGEGTNFNH
jgi:hypothetical protein